MNISSNLSCFTPQTFENITEFYECYQLVLKENALIGSCGILLTISVFVTNLWVMIMFITREQLNVFDKILIGHASVDWMTVVFSISWKHFVDVFGYWPFSYSFGIFWAIYDLSQHSVTALHMLYMSWIRLRSIQNPNNYKTEFIAKYPILMMISFWLGSIIIWSCVVIHYGIVEYGTDVNFSESDTIVNALFRFFFWALFLLITLILSIRIIMYLKVMEKNRCNMRNINSNLVITRDIAKKKEKKRNNRKLTSQTRFIIIITTFLVHWIPCCILSFITPLFNIYFSALLNNIINWITNVACLTDPIVILLVNPSLSCKRSIVSVE
jgi:hypothetical protein